MILRFCTLIVLLSLFACNHPYKAEKVNKNGKVRYAHFFRILKKKDHTQILIINPNTRRVDQKLALSRNPDLLNLDESFQRVKIPLQSIITLNGTDIGYLSRLGLTDRIKGISSAAYLDNRYLRNEMAHGNLKEFQELKEANPEGIMQTAKLLTYSGFGQHPAIEDRLKQLGVVCLPMYDWRETHPLGKAEWMVLLACFFEKETKAAHLFEQTVKRYQSLMKISKGLKKKPSVISGSVIGDTWYMPAANSFNATLFHHAACRYAGDEKPGTGSGTYTFEEVYRKHQHADIWINPMFPTKGALLQANQRYAYFKAFEKDQVWCYSHRMNYFWENSASEPDKVLSDLMQIFHPELQRKKLYFYRKIKS